MCEPIVLVGLVVAYEAWSVWLTRRLRLRCRELLEQACRAKKTDDGRAEGAAKRRRKVGAP